jgi:hypothetical protein
MTDHRVPMREVDTEELREVVIEWLKELKEFAGEMREKVTRWDKRRRERLTWLILDPLEERSSSSERWQQK